MPEWVYLLVITQIRFNAVQAPTNIQIEWSHSSTLKNQKPSGRVLISIATHYHLTNLSMLLAQMFRS